MTIYEVNLTVQDHVAAAYLTWLREHIAQILRLDGFRYASLSEAEGAAPGTHAFVVHYYLDDRESLEEYFTHHAAALRQDGIDRFGDTFSATRRVMAIAGEFE